MNKKEFAAAIAKKTGMTVKDAEAFAGAAIDVMTETLAKKEDVSFVGFGTFTVKERKERTGRNPRKPDETMVIPACNAVGFKVGKTLKEAVNK